MPRGYGPMSPGPSSDPYLGERIRIQGITGAGAVLLFVMFAILGILLYYAQFSGAVRWLVALGIVAVLAGLAWDQVSRRTAPLAPLLERRDESPFRGGELDSVAAAVRRADEGLVYNQVEVTTRVRSAFLERARLSRGLSPETMREVQRDRAALRAMIGDEPLADFLHVRTQDLEERYRWIHGAERADGFPSRFRDILSRMEDWR